MAVPRLTHRCAVLSLTGATCLAGLIGVAPAGAGTPGRIAGAAAAPSPTPSPAVTRSAPDAAALAPPGRAVLGGAALASPDVVVDTSPGVPPLPRTVASGWVVADLDTGEVLAARDAHGSYAPASVIKLLTALTLIPKVPANAVVTASPAEARIDGSKVGLVPGATYTAKDLFTAMLVVSGNDAATALADAAGGTDATVAAMAAEAHRLHAEDTVPRTPTGLDDPQQVTSAYDLALLARACLSVPDLMAYATTVKAAFPKPDGSTYQITNHNPLLTRYPGDLGLKNGFTTKAQASYVGVARRNGHTLAVTLLHTAAGFRPEAQALLDWGFAAVGSARGVGTLVAPGAPAAPAASAPPAAHPVMRAVATAHPGGGGPSLLDGVVLGGSAVLAGASWLRLRALARVRRRRRF